MLFKLAFVVTLATGSFLFTSPALATGTDVQNGGGGVVKDGHYMTFASAQIPIKDLPEMAADIPGMKFLIEQVSNLKLTSSAKSTLLSSIYPLQQRTYYKVDADHYGSDVRAQIINNYKTAMLIPDKENIVLFAVTDIDTQTTFLLPEFYQLKEIEQAAILLHESTWILDPSQSYSQVIALEMSAQSYFQKPSDQQLNFNFYKNLSVSLDDPESLLFAMIKIRYPQGGTIAADQLLGEAFWECMIRTKSDLPENPEVNPDIPDCTLQLANYLMPKIIGSSHPDVVQEALLQTYGYKSPQGHDREILLETSGISPWFGLDEVIDEDDLRAYIQNISIDLTPIEMQNGNFHLGASSRNRGDLPNPVQLTFQ